MTTLQVIVGPVPNQPIAFPGAVANADGTYISNAIPSPQTMPMQVVSVEAASEAEAKPT